MLLIPDMFYVNRIKELENEVKTLKEVKMINEDRSTWAIGGGVLCYPLLL